MARRDLTFRVFVSSTFSDLVAERNALQERVFPKLRTYCQQRGARFQAIDLRWGVSEEAALDQQTMNICIDELKRCRQVSPRPNFIVLLGDRYGWRPLPSRIEGRQSDALSAEVPAAERSLLTEWYTRDDNQVPAEYYLRPREVHDDAAAREAEAAAWTGIEVRLRTILADAARAVFPDPDDPRRRPFEQSATHQEIQYGALQVEDAARHVHCYFRHIEGLPDNGRASAYRDINHDRVDRDAQDRLKELTDRLAALFAAPDDHIYRYTAAWNDGNPKSDLDALCDRVERDLIPIIDAEVTAFGHRSALAREIETHDAFGRDRIAQFVGREDALSAIRAHLTGPSRHPFVVHGVSGAGKTALMAKTTERLRGSPAGQAPPMIVTRFIGTTPASSDVRSLLNSLCAEIGGAYGDGKAPLQQFQDLLKEFQRVLKLATADRPLVVLLDGLDQLDEANQARTLNWVPWALPDHVTLILSVLDADGPPGECGRTACDRVPVEQQLPVKPLSRADGERLLDGWMTEARRTLQPEQRSALLSTFERSGLPLQLRLACDEARLWKSHDVPPLLDADVSRLVGQVLERHEDERNQGRLLTSRALGYLAASRYGLAEDELLDVLSADEEVLKDFRRRSPDSPPVDRLPVVVWSRLRAALAPYLSERRAQNTTVLSFYHRQVGEAIAARYFDRLERETSAHEHLASYFRSLAYANPVADSATTGRSDVRRGVSELPYHLGAGHMWQSLEQTLTDFFFIEAKCSAGLVFDLSSDYARAARMWPDGAPRSIHEFSRALMAEASHLAVWPGKAFPQFYYQLSASADPVTRRALANGVQAYAARKTPWLRTISRGGASARLVAEEQTSIACAAVSQDRTIAVCASSRGTLRAVHLLSGESLWTSAEEVPVPISNVRFQEHDAPIPTLNVAVHPSNLVVGTRERRLFVIGTAPASATRVQRSGTIAHDFSSSADHLLWFNLETGERLGHAAGSHSSVISRNWQRVVSPDRSVLDTRTGERDTAATTVLQQNRADILAYDGRWAISKHTMIDTDTGTVFPHQIDFYHDTPDQVAWMKDAFVARTRSSIEVREFPGAARRALLESSERFLLWAADEEHGRICGLSRGRLVCWSTDGHLAREIQLDERALELRVLGDGLVLAGNLIWDPATGSQVGVQPSGAAIQCCWRDEQGLRAALVVFGNRLELWNLEELVAQGDHVEAVTHFDLSGDPCRLLLATGSRVQARDLMTDASPLRTLAETGPVSAIAVSRCGGHAAWVLPDGAMTIADTESGATIAQFSTGIRDAAGCRFHDRSEILVWNAREAAIWDMQRTRRRFHRTDLDNQPRREPLYLFPLVLFADDRGMTVCDVRLGCRLRRIRPRDVISSWAAAPDLRVLCTVHKPRFKQQEDRRPLHEQSRAWLWSIEPGGLVLAGLKTAALRIFGAFSSLDLGPLAGEHVRKGPDCWRCVPISLRDVVYQAGMTLTRKPDSGPEQRIVISHTPIKDFAVSGDGTAVVCAEEDGRLGMYAMSTGAGAWIAGSAPVRSCLVDRTGTHLAGLDVYGRLHVFDLQNGPGR